MSFICKFISGIVCSFLLFLAASTFVSASQSLYYIHSDQLGSTSIVTDSNGEIVSKESYYPFGETRGEWTNIDHQVTERAYTGQISDQDQTGLYYYNARYYNPQISKFTQADTISDGLNRYAYVVNNPINRTDPTGHMWDVGEAGGGYSDDGCRELYCRDVVSVMDVGSRTQAGIGPGGFDENGYPLGFAPDLSPPETIAAEKDFYYGEADPYLVYIMLGAPWVAGGGLAVCASNPACISAVIKTLTIADTADTLIDMGSCVGGDLDACGNVTNPIPGMTIEDELREVVKLTRAIMRAKQSVLFMKAKFDPHTGQPFRAGGVASKYNILVSSRVTDPYQILATLEHEYQHWLDINHGITNGYDLEIRAREAELMGESPDYIKKQVRIELDWFRRQLRKGVSKEDINSFYQNEVYNGKYPFNHELRK